MEVCSRNVSFGYNPASAAVRKAQQLANIPGTRLSEAAQKGVSIPTYVHQTIKHVKRQCGFSNKQSAEYVNSVLRDALKDVRALAVKA